MSSDSLPSILPPDIFPPEIAQVTAPLLFGIVFAWLLYGMLVVQVYIYHICFKDRAIFQVFVYGVFFIDTLQTCFMGADLFYWFGTGYGNISHIANVYLSFFDTPMLGSLTALLIHSFFGYRIWILSRSIVLPTLIVLISTISLGGAWTSAIMGHLSGNPTLSPPTFTTAPIYLWLIGTAITDTIVALTMTFLLMRARGIHQKTNAKVNRVVILTMETNCLSALMAILALTLYFAQTNSSYFITPIYILGKSYSNSLLVILNNRFFISSSIGPGNPKPSTNSSSSGTKSSEFLSTLRMPTVSYSTQVCGDGGVSESPSYPSQPYRKQEVSDSIELHEKSLKHPYGYV